MAALIVIAIAGVLCLAWLLWWQRRDRGRMVECAACGRPLPASRAVVIADAQDYPDGPGGTAIVVEFHPGCAPSEQPNR